MRGKKWRYGKLRWCSRPPSPYPLSFWARAVADGRHVPASWPSRAQPAHSCAQPQVPSSERCPDRPHGRIAVPWPSGGLLIMAPSWSCREQRYDSLPR
jgi:hypothetical protein